MTQIGNSISPGSEGQDRLPDLFSRDEVLGGLVDRRAHMLLFTIEARTTYLVAQSKQATDQFLSEEVGKEREVAFLDAFSQARPLPFKPSIQDIERFASQWAMLAPETPRMRAALAHVMAQKYTFTAQSVPGMRRVLAWDSPEVQQAYQRYYKQSLDSIYAPQVGLLERARWAWARFAGSLENMPPFWTAFALTLTEVVGGGILAVPIALAGLGPLPGIALLIFFGLINAITVVFYAEAITRSGSMRYGQAYLGRMVQDYLGQAGSQLLSFATLVLVILVVLAYYLGVSSTLASLTHIHAGVWIALLFAAGLYIVARNQLDMTVALSLLISGVNLLILLVLCLFGFRYIDPAYLAYANLPFVGGRPFDASILGLVFGVIMFVYFGHLSVGVCARPVLKQDPGGRSLMYGVLAAQCTAILIYVLFILAINGSLSPEALAAETSTALAPLARRAGGAVHVLGTIFVILGMGLGVIQYTFVVFNLVRERLPRRVHPVITLPARKGRLLLSGRKKQAQAAVFCLSYLGQENGRLRMQLEVQLEGRNQKIEFHTQDHWELNSLYARWPKLAGVPENLALDVIRSSPKSACIRVDTSMRLAYQGEWDTTGLGMAAILDLDPEQRELVTWLMRQGPSCIEDLCDCLGVDPASASELLGLLEDEGLIGEVEKNGRVYYQVLFRSRSVKTGSAKIWQALGMDDAAPGEQEGAQVGGLDAQSLAAGPGLLNRLFSSERGRIALSLSPVGAVFLLAEWAAITGSGSFSEVLGIVGTLIMPLLAGIFPVLLLVASRRKGERLPEKVYRFLGNPLLLGFIYALTLASLFLHGLVIWQTPVARLLALIVGLATLAISVSMLRKGAFTSRHVVELRAGTSQPGQFVFNSLAGGQSQPLEVNCQPGEGAPPVQGASGEFPGCQQVTFCLPNEQVQELAVWAHRVSPELDSENFSGTIELRTGARVHTDDLPLSGGPLVLPHDGSACQVTVFLNQAE